MSLCARCQSPLGHESIKHDLEVCVASLADRVRRLEEASGSWEWVHCPACHRLYLADQAHRCPVPP